MGVGKVPGETGGGCKRAYKVTMTTLWAAPTSHHHTVVLMLKSEQLLANHIREFCYNYEYNENTLSCTS